MREFRNCDRVRRTSASDQVSAKRRGVIPLGAEEKPPMLVPSGGFLLSEREPAGGDRYRRATSEALREDGRLPGARGKTLSFEMVQAAEWRRWHARGVLPRPARATVGTSAMPHVRFVMHHLGVHVFLFVLLFFLGAFSLSSSFSFCVPLPGAVRMKVNPAIMRIVRRCRRHCRFHRTVAERCRLRWMVYFDAKPLA